MDGPWRVSAVVLLADADLTSSATRSSMDLAEFWEWLALRLRDRELTEQTGIPKDMAPPRSWEDNWFMLCMYKSLAFTTIFMGTFMYLRSLLSFFVLIFFLQEIPKFLLSETHKKKAVFKHRSREASLVFTKIFSFGKFNNLFKLKIWLMALAYGDASYYLISITRVFH